MKTKEEKGRPGREAVKKGGDVEDKKKYERNKRTSPEGKE